MFPTFYFLYAFFLQIFNRLNVAIKISNKYYIRLNHMFEFTIFYSCVENLEAFFSQIKDTTSFLG